MNRQLRRISQQSQRSKGDTTKVFGSNRNNALYIRLGHTDSIPREVSAVDQAVIWLAENGPGIEAVREAKKRFGLNPKQLAGVCRDASQIRSEVAAQKKIAATSAKVDGDKTKLHSGKFLRDSNTEITVTTRADMAVRG